MSQHRDIHSPHQSSELERIERRARRITDRYTWKRMFLLAALIIWLFRSCAALPYTGDQSYLAIWAMACIGCWTASGWLVDLPKMLFPNVAAFQHLSRPAPRDGLLHRR